MPSLCHLFHIITAQGVLGLQVVCVLAHKKSLFTLIMMQTTHRKKGLRGEKVINTFQETGLSKLMYLLTGRILLHCSKIFFSSWFLSFLYGLLPFYIAHPFVWISEKTAVMLAWYGWPHVLPPLEGAHILCSFTQNVVVMQVWK